MPTHVHNLDESEMAPVAHSPANRRTSMYVVEPMNLTTEGETLVSNYEMSK